MERKNDQEVIGQQSMNQSSARLFHRHGDGPACETLAELGHPGANDLGFLFESPSFFFSLAIDLQAEDMFLVGPIDADKGRAIILCIAM